MADRRGRRRRSKDKLIENGDEEDGISNPSLDTDTEAAYQTFSQTEGETSTAEIIEETEQAEVLKGELKSRHRRRRRELSKLVSPKDDLTGELKTVKLDSRKKIDETEQEEELAAALAAAGEAAEAESSLVSLPVDEDGTVPMPEEEKEEEYKEPKAPVSPAKTPDIPSEPSPKAEKPVEKKDEEEKKEEEPKPAERKRSTMRERMKSRLAKAKEEAESELEKEERDERKKTLSLKKETRFQEMLNFANRDRNIVLFFVNGKLTMLES